MHAFTDLSELVGEEYSKSIELFEELNLLRRAWTEYHPEPPLKRSEMQLLGIMAYREKNSEEPLTVGRLADIMRQSTPGVSQKVSVLERNGYLRRVTDKKDRRISTLRITPKGRKVAQSFLREFVSRIKKPLDLLGEKKTDTLLALLRELGQLLENTHERIETN